MEPNKDLQKNILDKIRHGEVVMRPRYHFVLKMIALALVCLAILIISIFILNFILFSIRINSQDTLLGFGARGLVAFLSFFPWGLLVIDAVLIVGLQWLVREFRVGYKIPILYVMAGLVAATLLAGFVIDRGTGLNDELLRRSDAHQLPGLDNVYDRARRMPPRGSGVCRCTITAIQGSTLTALDTRGTTTLTIELPQSDPNATTSGLKVGDTVLIAGDEDDGVIRAFGVRVVTADMPVPPPAPGQNVK